MATAKSVPTNKAKALVYILIGVIIGGFLYFVTNLITDYRGEAAVLRSQQELDIESSGKVWDKIYKRLNTSPVYKKNTKLPKTTGNMEALPKTTGNMEKLPKTTGNLEALPKTTGNMEALPKTTGN